MAGKLQELFNKFIWDTEKRYGGVVYPNTFDPVFWGNKTSSGRTVSTDSALTLSAVYRAVNIKAGFISSLPFQVFRKTSKGRELVTDHPVSYLLSRKPNEKMSKAVFLDRAMQHFELLGNHFAYIKKNGIGKPVEIMLLHDKDVKVIEGPNKLVYKVNGMEDLVSADNMIHVPNMGDGVNGKSVLSFMREDASLMMDVRDYGESFFGRGGKPAGLLTPQTQVAATQRQEMKDSFTAAKKQGGEVAMPYGWKYEQISIPPKDADWITTNDFAISTVARWFGVPTQKLGDSAVKYSNVEFMGIEFLQDTMAPIAAKFENEYTNKLFSLSSEQDYYVEFNLDAYLRADSLSKAEAIAKRVQNAQLTPNEGRALDNRPALDGGDDLFIQGATVPLSLQKEMLKKQPTATRQSLKKKIIEAVKKGEDAQLIIEGILGNDGKGY